MPVGVPKVPFQIPGDEEATWVDLNRLYRERFLFLGKEVEEELANQIVGLMIYLNLEDPTRDQFMFINSPGGYVLSGLAVHDAIQYVIPPVYTICIGVAASMACFILIGGEITGRMAFPHARVMMHQPASAYYKANPEGISMDTEDVTKIYEMIIEVYAQLTGRSPQVIRQDMKRDRFMTPTEALDYGIIDSIGLDPILHKLTKTKTNSKT
uniref:ATP-dependent Clp protease proteolytic subunit n=1 Tax=Sagittaria lichuanensis TaxID=258219 RepID=A0A142CRZ1_9LILI|nr:clp protease proteolytic subunit [Sagittaria lichuanensis]AMQ13516.1 clp protease proteolytic subunit [Sagittaria lichuanensis]